MVLGAKPAEHTHAEGGFEVTSLPAASHICIGPRAMLADNAFQFRRDFVNSPVPGDSFKTITHTLQRVFEAVGIMLMIRYIHPFAAEVALAFSVGLVSFDLDDTVVFNLHLQTLPGFTMPGDTSGTTRYFEEDLVDQQVVLDEEGMIGLPKGPGIGAGVLPDVLNRHLLATETLVP